MRVCKAIRALLMVVAGAELFVNVSLAGLSGVQIAGLLLLLSGVIKLVHAFGMCGACGSCCTETKKK